MGSASSRRQPGITRQALFLAVLYQVDHRHADDLVPESAWFAALAVDLRAVSGAYR
jgi:hypothetical protein